MGKMTRRMVDALIAQKDWHPFIKAQELDFSTTKRLDIISFIGHEQFEYKCSPKTAREILAEGK